ncbi:MAG: glycosyltransferase [Nodosilinea sp. LVE1205-7]|jgi:glycosyltransferase involved in cell wall biosynthesis
MISIIIPTLNRYQLLKSAIDSCCQQDFPSGDYEILVIDNGSTDKTKEVVFQLIHSYPNHSIRYFLEPIPGLLSGRHRGAIEANGEILVYIDDDIQASPQWLKSIQSTMENSEIQLLGGRNLPSYEVDPPDWLNWFWIKHPYGKWCSKLSLLDFGNSVIEIDANFVWGLNFTIRKSALLELGGFHPDSFPKHLQFLQGNGETGLTVKANNRGYKAVYQPSALVYHFVPESRMTIDYFKQRYFFSGVCDSYTKIRYTFNHSSDANDIEKIKNTLRKFKQKIGTLPALLSYQIQVPSEVKNLQNVFHTSYQEGYRFHQQVVLNDPILLKWVTKPDYWDYSLPISFENFQL